MSKQTNTNRACEKNTKKNLEEAAKLIKDMLEYSREYLQSGPYGYELQARASRFLEAAEKEKNA